MFLPEAFNMSASFGKQQKLKKGFEFETQNMKNFKGKLIF